MSLACPAQSHAHVFPAENQACHSDWFDRGDVPNMPRQKTRHALLRQQTNAAARFERKRTSAKPASMSRIKRGSDVSKSKEKELRVVRALFSPPPPTLRFRSSRRPSLFFVRPPPHYGVAGPAQNGLIDLERRFIDIY
jgi:hypothetical protein